MQPALSDLWQQFLPDGESRFSTDSAGFADAIGVPDAIAPLDFARAQYGSSKLPSIVSFDEWMRRQYLDARIVQTPWGDVLTGRPNPAQGDWGLGESASSSAALKHAILGTAAVAFGGAGLDALGGGAAFGGSAAPAAFAGATTTGTTAGGVLAAVKDVVGILSSALQIKNALDRGDDPPAGASFALPNLAELFPVSTSTSSTVAPSAQDLAAAIGGATAAPGASPAASPTNVSLTLPSTGIDPEIARIGLYALLAYVAYKIVSRK